MENGFKQEVLKEISEKLLMKKREIILLLEGKVEDPSKAANEIANSLLAQGFIAIAPVGDGTFAVTQKGMRAAKV